jgi:hypothetical protein
MCSGDYSLEMIVLLSSSGHIYVSAHRHDTTSNMSMIAASRTIANHPAITQISYGCRIICGPNQSMRNLLKDDALFV